MNRRSWFWRLAAVAVSCLAWGCGPEVQPPAAPEAPEMLGSEAAPVGSFTGYVLPWPVGQVGAVVRRDGVDHQYQVDFDIPGPVVAVKPGTVVFVKQSSNSGCGSLSCWQQANMVVVQHDSGEYSWYVHLAYGSVPVVVGTYVSAGTRLGMEGATGYATGPHLHFMVSSGHTAWTNPGDPNAAPWATGIYPVNFLEAAWGNLSGWPTSANGADVSVACQAAGTMDLFIQGMDNQLHRGRLSGGVWQNWQVMGGVLTSAPDADSWDGTHKEAIVRGITNEIFSRRWDSTLGWGAFLSLGTPDGSATSDPSVTALGSGVLEVFVRGQNRSLWRRRYNSNGWQAWNDMGGTLVGGPDAMSWGAGHSDVFVLGTDGNLWHRFRLAGTLSGWDSMGAPPVGISSDPGAVCDAPYSCHLFVRGGDRALWARDFNGTWSGWYSLGGVITSGPDAASCGAGHTEVWARGVSGNAFRRVWTSGAWGPWQDMGATP